MKEPRSIRLIDDRWTTVRHVVEAVAIVGAALWAFYTFVYQERIKPASAIPTEQFDLTWDRGEVVRGVRVANLKLAIKNTGVRTVDVYAFAIDVYGTRFVERSAPAATARPGVATVDRRVPSSPRELVYAWSELRDAARGGMRNSHILLRPGETTTQYVPIAVREGRFDMLVGRLRVAFGAPAASGSLAIGVERRRDGTLEIDAPHLSTDDEEVSVAL